jgi:ribosome biogenesis GTPase
VPGRVIREHRGRYRVMTEGGEVVGTASGRMRLDALGKADLPGVGDWVALRPPSADGRAYVQAVVPRRSAFRRRAAGEENVEQVLACNVDTVFLVSGLDHDFNPRRIERYVVLAWESGARPVVVLNKADLRDDVGSAAAGSRRSPPASPCSRSARAIRSRCPCWIPTCGPGARSACWDRPASASRRC